MKIAIGCDHRGFAAKNVLLPSLRHNGHDVDDFGCFTPSAIDYPDIAYPLAIAVARGDFEIGILLDDNGMGMGMVANKVPGIRAAVVIDQVCAACAREKHHCNVLCIGTELIGGDYLRQIVDNYLAAGQAGGRYARRVEKLMQIERQAHHPDHPSPSTHSRSSFAILESPHPWEMLAPSDHDCPRGRPDCSVVPASHDEPTSSSGVSPEMPPSASAHQPAIPL